jgi:hypothetical protein
VSIEQALRLFFEKADYPGGIVTSERALQLELAFHLRSTGYQVSFERPFRVAWHTATTCKTKANLDLLVEGPEGRTGIELKVPLNGQHPETMFSFAIDLAFVEAIKAAGQIDNGYCLMLTPDRAFWSDSGRGSDIHNRFRQPTGMLCGIITKPTGSQGTAVSLSGVYQPALCWREVANTKIMPRARYCLIATH